MRSWAARIRWTKDRLIREIFLRSYLEEVARRVTRGKKYHIVMYRPADASCRKTISRAIREAEELFGPSTHKGRGVVVFEDMRPALLVLLRAQRCGEASLYEARKIILYPSQT